MKLIDISKLNPDKCYELSDDGNSLVEVDIISGEYSGISGRPPIESFDMSPIELKACVTSIAVSLKRGGRIFAVGDEKIELSELHYKLMNKAFDCMGKGVEEEWKVD